MDLESRGIVLYYVAKTKVIAQLISAFGFATQKIQSLFFQNPKLKFQVPSHLMWLYSPVCVGPAREPRRQVFSQRSSVVFCLRISVSFAWNGTSTGKVLLCTHTIIAKTLLILFVLLILKTRGLATIAPVKGSPDK